MGMKDEAEKEAKRDQWKGRGTWNRLMEYVSRIVPHYRLAP